MRNLYGQTVHKEWICIQICQTQEPEFLITELILPPGICDSIIFSACHTCHAFFPGITHKFGCGELVGRPVNGSVCFAALAYFFTLFKKEKGDQGWELTQIELLQCTGCIHMHMLTC